MDSNLFLVDSVDLDRRNRFRPENYAVRLESAAGSNHHHGDHSHISASRRHSLYPHVMVHGFDFDFGFDFGLAQHIVLSPVLISV
jgi:hypothetical protein